jgi:hypothetical protein
MMGPTYVADYIMEILGQKWWALRNNLALRNRQNLVLGKNNQVSLLTIGQILGTAAENTGWLKSTILGWRPAGVAAGGGKGLK